jgi:serine phosphatase RsbU (regulator of sigma subunit)
MKPMSFGAQHAVRHRRQDARHSCLVNPPAQPTAVGPLLPWLTEVLEKALERTGSITAHISFFDPTTSNMICMHAVGKYAEVYAKLSGPPRLGVAQRAAREKKVILIEDILKAPEHEAAKQEALDAGWREYLELLDSFQSEIAIPLFGSNSTVIAVVNLHHPKKSGLTRHTLGIVTKLLEAASAASAIENAIPYAALWESSDCQAQKEDAIRRIKDEEAGTRLDRQSSLWKRIVREGAKVARAEAVELSAYEEASGHLHVCAVTPASAKYTAFQFSASKGIRGTVFTEKSPRYCADNNDRGWEECIPGMRSCYVTPLRDGSNVLGVLCFYSFRTDAFASSVRDALDSFAERCTELILRSIAEIHSRVKESLRSLLDADDDRDLCRRAVAGVLKLTGGDGASFFLVSGVHKSLDLVATTGLAPGFDKETNYPIDEGAGITPWVAVKGLPLRLKNCGDTRELRRWDSRMRWKGRTREVCSGGGFGRPLILAPVPGEDGRVQGVLRVSGGLVKPEFFEEDKIALVQYARLLGAELHRPRAAISTLTHEMAKIWADPNACLELILDRSMKLSQADAGTISVLEGEILKTVAHRGELAISVDDLTNVIRSDSVTTVCAKSWATQVVEDVGQEDWKKVYKSCFIGIQSEMAVPLVYLSELCGVINLESKHKLFFTQERQVQIERLAGVAASYVVHQGLYHGYQALLGHQKLEGAAYETYREALFSKSAGCLQIPSGCDVSGYVISRPCGSAIGGDFFDCIKIDDATAGLVLLDGEGHGAIAALQMLPLATAFKTNARGERSTKHVLGKILTAAREMHVRGTAIYLIVTKKGNKWHLFGSSAGHPQIIIVHQRGGIRPFPREDLANLGMLGPLEESQMGEDHAELCEGDLIVGFTDGVYEGTGLGEHGAELAIAGAIGRVREAELEVIAKAVEEWALRESGGRFVDDVTIIVLRVGKTGQ